MPNMPVKYTRISSWYNEVSALRNGRKHSGIDFAAPEGTPVRPMQPGRVAGTGYNKDGLGYYISIVHDDGMVTVYGHLRSMPTVSGNVETNTVIGEVGQTGHATGPHLHFEVRINGEAKDPSLYLGLSSSSSAPGDGGGTINTILSNENFQTAANALSPILERDAEKWAKKLLAYK